MEVSRETCDLQRQTLRERSSLFCEEAAVSVVDVSGCNWGGMR